MISLTAWAIQLSIFSRSFSDMVIAGGIFWKRGEFEQKIPIPHRPFCGAGVP
jgi:hypothetical protein